MTPIDTKNLAAGLAQVRALREAAPGDIERGPISPHKAVLRMLHHGMVKTVAHVFCGPVGLHAPDIASLLAAAPAMAELLDAYAARLEVVEGERNRLLADNATLRVECERLAEELAEARKMLAAERSSAIRFLYADGWDEAAALIESRHHIAMRAADAALAAGGEE